MASVARIRGNDYKIVNLTINMKKNMKKKK